LDERADQLVAVATEQGFPVWRAMGTVHRSWVMVKTGDLIRGIPLLRSSWAGYRATGTDMWTPYNTALLARPSAIAEEQEAKLWGLRATVSLARLRRDQGRRAETRDLLAPVYNWFTEGFGTPDLKEAKVLLDELG
jgi:hypothetical protein